MLQGNFALIFCRGDFNFSSDALFNDDDDTL